MLLLLLGWGRPESILLLLAWLRRWPSKCVERILAHRPLHTWLVSIHSHLHAASHASHAHSTHRLLLGHHRVRLAHLVHATHSLHSSHRLEWHRLKGTCCMWLLYRAKGVCLGLLLSLISVHELSEWICSGQLLLSLELIWLWLRPSSRLLLIIVEALKHRKLVRVGYRGGVGSQRLISRRKDIAQRIRSSFARGLGASPSRRIGREYIE